MLMGWAEHMGPGQREREGRSGVVPSRRVPGQSGFTLIEVIIAISLAGILTAALTTGIVFMFRANASLTEEQQLQRVLGNFAENIRSLNYVSCTSPALATGIKQDLARAEYVKDLVDLSVVEPPNPPGSTVLKPAAGWRPVENVTVEIVDLQFWRATAAPGVAEKTYNSACPDGRDDGSQLLTLQARIGDKTATTQVVKSVRANVGPGGTP
jgi:prepilin-type N-terminal cleavage/methylation domain-containing protein